jgi:hypothetical protein
MIFVVSLFFYARAIFQNVPDKTRMDQIFLSVWILIIASFAVPGYTRPELLVKALFSVLILLTTRKNIITLLATGIITSAIGMTSPVAGIYMIPLSALIVLQNKYSKKELVILGFGVIIGIILFVCFYPFQWAELFWDMSTHAQNVVFERSEERSWSNFWFYHLLNPNNAMGLLLAFVSLFSLPFFIGRLKAYTLKVIFIISFILLLLLSIYFSFKAIPMAYYLYVLSPFMIASLLHLYFHLKNRTIKIILTAFCLLFCIGFFRNLLIVLPDTFNSKKSTISITQQMIKKYVPENESMIAISNGLWPYFTNRTRGEVELFDAHRLSSYNMIILQQYGSGLIQPPSLPGFEIIMENFSQKPVSFAGLKLASQSPFHQLAIYRKNAQ